MTITHSRFAMLNRHRRFLLPVVAVALLLLAGGALAIAPRLAGAQDSATPVAGQGIEKAVLGTEVSAVAPDRVLILQRRTFAPGAESGDHAADGPVVLYVESGEVTFEVVDGAATVTRADGTTEDLMSGKEASLSVGDEVSYDQGVVHDVYNEGTVPAVTLESRFNPNPAAATATPTS
jgi:quercetin dioxygenase-like cupin family protein